MCFNDRGGQSDFFVSEILAKSDFFESMNLKDTRIFWVAKKAEGFFGVVKKGLSDFFLVKNMNLWWTPPPCPYKL